MRIAADKNQFAGTHGKSNKFKHDQLERMGVEVLPVPLPCGDYILIDDKVEEVLKRKEARGVPVKKMDMLGTYSLSVDSKASMLEICGNLCGKDHGRVRDEAILAQNNHIRLIILVENSDGIKTIQDVFEWQNPRMHRYNKIAYMHRMGKWQNIPMPKAPPTSGSTLAKAMLTMEQKYGVEFRFCKPTEAAQKIVDILSEGMN